MHGHDTCMQAAVQVKGACLHRRCCTAAAPLTRHCMGQYRLVCCKQQSSLAYVLQTRHPRLTTVTSGRRRSLVMRESGHIELLFSVYVETWLCVAGTVVFTSTRIHEMLPVTDMLASSPGLAAYSHQQLSAVIVQHSRRCIIHGDPLLKPSCLTPASHACTGSKAFNQYAESHVYLVRFYCTVVATCYAQLLHSSFVFLPAGFTACTSLQPAACSYAEMYIGMHAPSQPRDFHVSLT